MNSYSPSSPYYLRHKRYPICVLSSRKLTWPLAKNCTRLTDQTMMMRKEENVWVFDDRNHWSQRLIAILFKPFKKAEKRGEKSLNTGWANESPWDDIVLDHDAQSCMTLKPHVQSPLVKKINVPETYSIRYGFLGLKLMVLCSRATD